MPILADPSGKTADFTDNLCILPDPSGITWDIPDKMLILPDLSGKTGIFPEMECQRSWEGADGAHSVYDITKHPAIG